MDWPVHWYGSNIWNNYVYQWNEGENVMYLECMFNRNLHLLPVVPFVIPAYSNMITGTRYLYSLVGTPASPLILYKFLYSIDITVPSPLPSKYNLIVRILTPSTENSKDASNNKRKYEHTWSHGNFASASYNKVLSILQIIPSIFLFIHHYLLYLLYLLV